MPRIGTRGIKFKICCSRTDGAELAPSFLDTFRGDEVVNFVSGPERDVVRTASPIRLDNIDGEVRLHRLRELAVCQSLQRLRRLVAEAVSSEIGSALPGLSRKCFQL